MRLNSAVETTPIDFTPRPLRSEADDDDAVWVIEEFWEKYASKMACRILTIMQDAQDQYALIILHIIDRVAFVIVAAQAKPDMIIDAANLRVIRNNLKTGFYAFTV